MYVKLLLPSYCTSLLIKSQTYFVDLVLANLHKKDRDAMCHAFEAMIDKAEEVYGVYVIALCCDNNGGSQHRRKNVVLKQPYLFGLPCYAHQICQSPFGKNKFKTYIVVPADGWGLFCSQC